jgi:hypothetical protein
MDYEFAKKLLNGRSFREVDYNTFLHVTEEGINLKYYHTDILTFRKDGSTVLDTKKIRTKTTLQRLNKYMPSAKKIHMKNDQWIWDDGREFKDGTKISADGSLKNPYRRKIS